MQIEPRTDRAHRFQQLRHPGGQLGRQTPQTAGRLGGGVHGVGDRALATAPEVPGV
ncbi:hypothetical protein RB199_08445 [Streptomyces libani]